MSSAAVHPIDTFATFATPEHIGFHYRLAGPLVRGAAYVIDWFIRAALMLISGIILTLIIGPFVGDMVTGLWLVVIFCIDWLYGALFEWLWKGYTPGKRAVGIKVVDSDGLPAGVGACFIRNLLRSADGMPVLVSFFPTFVIGLLTMSLGNRRFQRLGDLAAGTLVIYVERSSARKIPRFADEKLLRRVDDLPAGLEGRINAETLRAISAYIIRRRRLSPARRNEIAAHLAEPLHEVHGIDGSWGSDELLCALYVRTFQAEEGRSGAQAMTILRQRGPHWRQLDELAESAPAQRGQASDFAAQYRSTCADLAIADAYQLPDEHVNYLHDLVARVHLAFYRRIEINVSALKRKLFVEVPARLYHDGCLRMALVAFFGVFGICALLGWYQPEIVIQYLGADHAYMLRDMYSQPVNDREFGQGTAMSGFYIFNNVGIALACFAGGIFLGVGSLIYLVYNGIVLGLSFGYMATVDRATRSHFFEFVTAHGPFELFGIALSGAAGMRLGLGLVVRDGTSRMNALKKSSQRAFPILAVAALFVAAAAPIEGFISPSSLSITAKRTVAVLCGVVIVVYMIVLGKLGHSRLQQQGVR